LLIDGAAAYRTWCPVRNKDIYNMLWTIISVSTFWFWGGIFLIGILISEMIDAENGGGATAVAIATAVIVVLFSDFQPTQEWTQYLWPLVWGALGYFVAGGIWGCAKWWLWLRMVSRKLDEIETEVRSSRKGWSEIDVADEVTNYWRRAGLPTQFPVLVGQHRAKIMGWMMFWPCSMVWTVINDPVRRGFEEVYSAFGRTFQNMSDRAFSSRIKR